MKHIIKFVAALLLISPAWSDEVLPTVRVYQGSTRGSGLRATKFANPIKLLDNCIVYICTTDAGNLNMSGDTDVLVYALTHPQLGKIYASYYDVNAFEYGIYGLKSDKTLGSFHSAIPDLFASFSGNAKNGILDSFKIAPSSQTFIDESNCVYSTVTGSFRMNTTFAGYAQPQNAAAAVEAYLRSRGYRLAP